MVIFLYNQYIFGSIFRLGYIQNCVIMNSVIMNSVLKRFVCRSQFFNWK